MYIHNFYLAATTDGLSYKFGETSKSARTRIAGVRAYLKTGIYALFSVEVEFSEPCYRAKEIESCLRWRLSPWFRQFHYYLGSQDFFSIYGASPLAICQLREDGIARYFLSARELEEVAEIFLDEISTLTNNRCGVTFFPQDTANWCEEGGMPVIESLPIASKIIIPEKKFFATEAGKEFLKRE